MPEKDEVSPQLVVVGASAGGIDALSTLVSTLPADFPAPLVVAQHLDPRRPSHLPTILGNRSVLPVRAVDDHAVLEPGVVFVVPSNRHVEISDHEVRVTEAGEAAPRPSVNRLFESAAGSFGENLIAVILSGTGSDGAAGARHVKSAGGTVVIQNPETAGFPEMPQSLAPTIVDIVADIDSIGPLLHELVSGSNVVERPEEENILRTFLARLRDSTGIDFSSYKRPTILRRLHRRMVATNSANLRDYVRFVSSHPEESQRLTSSLLIKVTEFFRDADLFEYLRAEILPKLIEAARTRDDEIRIWSAGCATGEEAYSIAIMMSEALGDTIDQFGVRIFATDLDADAVNFARRGIYSPAAVATLPKEMVDRYFLDTGGEFEIKKRVRTMTVFGQHDLAQRAPFPRIDLAMCRNVLIYFTPELQKRALQLFAFSLRENGYLVLGKAESTSPASEHFVLEQPRLKVYRRQGNKVLIPPGQIRATTQLVSARAQAARLPDQRRGHREAVRTTGADERAEALLLRLPVGVVTVDAAYDIQWINNAARRLLGIHSSGIGKDFVHLVSRLPSAEMRELIDAAFRQESGSRVFEVHEPAEDGPAFIQIVCGPVVGEAAEVAPEYVSLVVMDTTSEVLERRGLSEALAQDRNRNAELEERHRRLSREYAELLRDNGELTSANAELRSGNEELLVANEEVQAASEEVETLNEELQATNEELETLNEELQATVEELNTTNDDLEARTVELQDMTSSLEEQHRESGASLARLQSVLQGIPVPILVVDAHAQRVLVNAAFEEAFPPDVELEEPDGRPLPGDHPIERWTAELKGEQLALSARRDDGGRAWYRAHARTVSADEAFAGRVVTFTPVSEAEGLAATTGEAGNGRDAAGRKARGGRAGRKS